MSTFKVGDVVNIIDDRDYSITKVGSWGTIISVGDDVVRVAFKYTVGGDLGPFYIDKRHITLMQRKTREEMVLDKVKLMYSRQRSRGIVHV